jgi:hypothetical protein
MVVNDLDFVGVPIAPKKANAPLIVDSDAVLPLPIPFQAFQAVSRQCRERSDIRCGIEDIQFAKSRTLDRLESANVFPVKKTLGIRAAEGPDHNLKVYCFSCHVKQYNKPSPRLPWTEASAIRQRIPNLDGRPGCISSL